LILLCGATLLLAATPRARADADAEWNRIEAMESNAPADQWKSRDQARAGAIAYLGKQEQAIRVFIASYPDDPRTPDANLRLAHLLATLGDIAQDPAKRSEADNVLDELERAPAMRDRRADVEFARVSIFMQRVDAITGGNRDTMLEMARAFAREFPSDRRVAPLLAEVASAFEDQPATAHVLLLEAQPRAATPELQARIADDLKRLAMVGKPLEMQWTALDGAHVDLKNLRGSVVLIFFFASWSPPSMAELDWVQQLAAGTDSTRALGICLDKDPVAVPRTLAGHGITWPVYCDGLGWQGPLVRSLGINTLPALWLVDRKGILRALDAKADEAALIEKVSGEAGQ
jgi:hypothetical protein